MYEIMIYGEMFEIERFIVHNEIPLGFRKKSNHSEMFKLSRDNCRNYGLFELVFNKPENGAFLASPDHRAKRIFDIPTQWNAAAKAVKEFYAEKPTNENIMKTAKQAAAESTAASTEELKAIEVLINAAIDGKKRSCYVNRISQEAKSELLKLGYAIITYTGFGQYSVIEW